MKNLPVVLFAIILLSACKEKATIIDFGNKQIEDSTYIDGVEPAQKHYVLVEEFTGATCTACPKAKDLLYNISEANEERLIVMEIHPFGIGQATPVHDSRYDFRTEKGTVIKNRYFGKSDGIPAAYVDRLKFNGKGPTLQSPNWAGAINERLAKENYVNLEVKSVYNETSHKTDIEVKIALTANLSDEPKLSIVLIEDSLIDAQEFPLSETKFDYVFMHTFRDYLTAIDGDVFVTNGARLEAGRVFIRRYKNIDINPAWVVKHCKLIAFVHYNSGTNTEVLQAAEVHLAE